jgi:ERCC4-type nuclease
VIHLDTREKPPIPALLLARLGTHDYSRHTLKAGDFAIFDADGHSLGIEHKRPLDWLASLGDEQKNKEKRIWNQIERMKEWYSHSLIIRTGALRYSPLSGTVGGDKRETGWRSTAARLLEWSIAQQVPILQLDSIEEMLDLLVYLNKRAKSGCVVPGQGILHHAHNPERDGAVPDRPPEGGNAATDSGVKSTSRRKTTRQTAESLGTFAASTPLVEGSPYSPSLLGIPRL